MSEPVTLEKLDVRFTELLTTMKEGFDKAANDLASVKTGLMTEIISVKTGLQIEFNTKIEEVLITVKEGFDETASKTDLEAVRTELKSEIATVKSELKSEIATVKSELRTVQATMVTKNYLDEKLANLKGDLTQTNRALNDKTDYILSTLEDQGDICETRFRSESSKFRSEKSQMRRCLSGR